MRSVTQDRRTSRDAACTMIIGRDTSHMGPSALRAYNLTCSSAVISWLPANSNHCHVVCVNNVKLCEVRPGVFRQQITGTAPAPPSRVLEALACIPYFSLFDFDAGLSPSTQYRVTVRAKHIRAPGQAPPPAAPASEEAPGAYTDFRTLAKDLPDPPQVREATPHSIE